MRYPLWLRIAVQNGKILYPEIVQKRYEESLKKHYKNRVKISPKLSDVLVAPTQYRQGNYFCDFYYNDENYECVFTEYEISEKKKVEFALNLDFKPRVDYKFIEKFKLAFPERDELILYSGYKGIKQFRNGLQSNLLFWDKTFWYSYYKPNFMTAELERLVQEKKVKLLDVTGIENTVTKMMFVNEFEPFDLSRALPVSDSTITNYHAFWQKPTLPRLKVLLPLILFFIFFFYCVISPSFEYTDYAYEIYSYWHYPVIMLSIIFIFFLAKHYHFETVATQTFTKLYLGMVYIPLTMILGIFLMKGVILPYGGKLYTLLKPVENYELVVTNYFKGDKRYSNYKLDNDVCNHVIQLKDNVQNEYYYVCSSKDKDELGQRYRMSIKKSKFGYQIKSLQPID